MKPLNLVLAALLICLAALRVVPVQAWVGETETPDGEDPAISSYWHPRVRQWNELIIEEAHRRSLDPDLLASLVWMESRGRSYAVGPVGAVGLTQVMPKEAGFSWRPSREALFDPGINLFWGTRTLATVIGQGEGDIFNALAAYNGGWDQTQYRGPRIFATTIMRDYANAVALRHGLQPQDDWVAIFAVCSPEVRGPIWVADASRDDVYFFSRENWVPQGHSLIPEYVPPTSVVAHCESEDGATYDVGVWLYLDHKDEWIVP